MNENSRLPVPRTPLLPAPRPSRTPTLWQEAAPVVARSAALVAVGIIGEWLLRSVARSALEPARNGKHNSRRNKAVAKRRANDDEGVVTISETVIMTRKVTFRR
jgi:hypothetical protein